MIRFENNEQWKTVVGMVANGMKPCPRCGKWRENLYNVPHRYRSVLLIGGEYNFLCDYCIAEVSSKHRKNHELASIRSRECPRHGDNDGDNGACRPGIVYILDFVDIFKIGYTNRISSVASRLADAKRVIGCDGRVFHTIESSCGSGLERKLHKLYARKLVFRNEYFSLEDDTLDLLKRVRRINFLSNKHDMTIDCAGRQDIIMEGLGIF